MQLMPVAASTHVFLRKQALEAGHDDRSIRDLVRNGVWHRVRRGAYLDAETWADLDDAGRHHALARAVLLQAKAPLVLSHISAIPVYGAPLWSLPTDVVHVTRLGGRAGRAEAGVRQHRGRLQAGDVLEQPWGSVTTPTKTALDVTTLTSTEAALCVVNDMVHRGLTTVSDLKARYVAMEHDPKTLGTDLVLRLADPRIESVGETRTYFLCWDQGLPAPEPQWKVVVGGRVVARLDFAWPQLGVWVEFDGKEKYVKFLREGESVVDVVLREKRREERIAEITGWKCVRITWADLAHPERTAARIRAQFASSAA